MNSDKNETQSVQIEISLTQFIVIVIGVGILFLIGGGMFYFLNKKGWGLERTIEVGKEEIKKEPAIVTDKLIVPQTKSVSAGQGMMADKTAAFAVPLVPEDESEKVILKNASYTVKGAYEKSLPLALSWQKDATLSFIKALGTVNVDGRSTSWQIVFVSKSKTAGTDNGYEIILQDASVLSKKAVPASSAAGELPKDWLDSDQAIKVLAAMPQFKDDTIAGLTFSYNRDSKSWFYAFPTKTGTTSVRAER